MIGLFLIALVLYVIPVGAMIWLNVETWKRQGEVTLEDICFGCVSVLVAPISLICIGMEWLDHNSDRVMFRFKRDE